MGRPNRPPLPRPCHDLRRGGAPETEQTPMVGTPSGVIGRDTELAAGDGFLDALAAGPAMLVLEGEPGIGKTTVWSSSGGRARDRGYLVPQLAARPVRDRAPVRRPARPARRPPGPPLGAAGPPASRWRSPWPGPILSRVGRTAHWRHPPGSSPSSGASRNRRRWSSRSTISSGSTCRRSVSSPSRRGGSVR